MRLEDFSTNQIKGSHMPHSRAISQALSIVIVFSVILAAFLGYGLSYLNRPTPSTVTLTENATPSTVTLVSVETQTVSDTKTLVTITEYVVTEGIQTHYVTISGSCTWEAGTLQLPSMTTTTYLSSTNITGDFSATITTVSSSTVSQKFTTTTVTSTTSTTGCPTII